MGTRRFSTRYLFRYRDQPPPFTTDLSAIGFVVQSGHTPIFLRSQQETPGEAAERECPDHIGDHVELCVDEQIASFQGIAKRGCEERVDHRFFDFMGIEVARLPAETMRKTTSKDVPHKVVVL
jgi:hypothetical protein